MKNFAETYQGYLSGILRWEDWDRLRHHVTGSGEPWYVYAVGHGIPDQPVSGEALAMVLAELDALLRRDHDEPYFGIAYADRTNARENLRPQQPGLELRQQRARHSSRLDLVPHAS